MQFDKNILDLLIIDSSLEIEFPCSIHAFPSPSTGTRSLFIESSQTVNHYNIHQIYRSEINLMATNFFLSFFFFHRFEVFSDFEIDYIHFGCAFRATRYVYFELFKDIEEDEKTKENWLDKCLRTTMWIFKYIYIYKIIRLQN